MTFRFKICLAAWIVTIAVSIVCGTARADSFDTGDGWAIEISPGIQSREGHNVVVLPAVIEEGDDGTTATTELPADSTPVTTQSPGEHYRYIYESIPFNRAEYNVNPSYRHDSTMEILTGNARHQTIVHHNPAPVVRPRTRLRPRGFILPSRYNQRRRGLNHYFRIPLWNWAGLY